MLIQPIPFFLVQYSTSKILYLVGYNFVMDFHCFCSLNNNKFSVYLQLMTLHFGFIRSQLTALTVQTVQTEQSTERRRKNGIKRNRNIMTNS